MDWADVDFLSLLGLLGPFSIAVSLLILGLLSKRLGDQGSARPYYLGFFAGATLIAISIGAQFLELLMRFPHTESDVLWVILAEGLPALAVTFGVISAWRYWSWLLAERD